MKDLLAYLFGGSQVENEVEETKSAIEHIMEEAEKQEPLKVKRTPLINALKALGIDDVSNKVEYDPEGFALVCPDEGEYRRYVETLMSPDAMEKLAKLGWVVTRCGDVAMTNEPAEFRIRFLEISGTDDSEKDAWPAPNPKLVADLIKKGREFATTPMDRDSENEINPVENPTTAPNQKHAGVGKEQQGKDPEGKPKGSGKSEALNLADQLLDVNEEERCPHCEGQGYVDDEGNPHSDETKDERCHVCPRCKGRKTMPKAHAARYKRGVEREVSKNLGKPWKYEARHKAGCQCGFCKNMGSFGKKKEESEAEEPEEQNEAHQVEVDYVDKHGKSRKVPFIRKGKAPQEEAVEPPRYDDMFEAIAKKKKLTQPKQGGKVPKSFKK